MGNKDPHKAGTKRMAKTGTHSAYGEPILSNLNVPAMQVNYLIKPAFSTFSKIRQLVRFFI